MANKIDTAMNVLGTAALGKSLLDVLGTGSKKTPGRSKLSKFYASLKKHNIAKTNRFDVEFAIPPILGPSFNSSETQQLLQLRCEAANVPGVTVTTADVQRYGYGLHEKIPTGATMSDFTCSFIGDSEGLIYKFFYLWTTGIVKWDEKPNAGAKPSYNQLRPYEHEYKQRYATRIQLYTYNESDDNLIGYQLHDAFPVSIGEIQYNWGDTDNLVRIPINFAYSYFTVDKIESSIASFKPRALNSLGMFESIVKAGTAVQTIAALKKPQSIGDMINVVNNAKNVISGYGGFRSLFGQQI